MMTFSSVTLPTLDDLENYNAVHKIVPKLKNNN